MIAICFGIYLSFTMSSMLCFHGLRVIHNQHFEPTLLPSNIRPILFEFYDLQYIQYNMGLRYILTDHWLLDQTVSKLIAFCSRRFIACHSKPSILNNAGVMWCAKGKSYAGPHVWSSQKTKIFQLTRNLLSKIFFENEEMIVAVCLSDYKWINSIDIGKHASTCTISLCKCPSWPRQSSFTSELDLPFSF